MHRNSRATPENFQVQCSRGKRERVLTALFFHSLLYDSSDYDGIMIKSKVKLASIFGILRVAKGYLILEMLIFFLAFLVKTRYIVTLKSVACIQDGLLIKKLSFWVCM
jgi:hypothetical protein